MKKFLFMAFGLLMACVAYAASDVGMTYEQPTTTVQMDYSFLTAPADVDITPMVLEVANVMMYDAHSIAAQATLTMPTSIAADSHRHEYGRASKSVPVPSASVAYIKPHWVVPQNTAYISAHRRCRLIHFRNHGHNH
ncbi:MAG: hypothetical protein IJ640_09255 [Prevotella sp.]|nr:hypothetical protein [Prevotella sp.]